MQHTYYPDNPEDYPDKLEVKDVQVHMHGSLMACTHDYSCPVCREEKAVLSSGIMQPCWTCQVEGFRVVQRDLDKIWWQFWKSELK